MAHHKSALKRIRQTRTRKIYNRHNTKTVKLAIRAVRESKTSEEGIEKLRLAMKAIDRATAHGVIHKNNAARRKSRLAKKVANLTVKSA
ncbi:MAG: small subunit ribosomal protein [Bacteroidota bacterium]|nr:small subunit ribosomal protein [Bacteroidota bacterium]